VPGIEVIQARLPSIDPGLSFPRRYDFDRSTYVVELSGQGRRCGFQRIFDDAAKRSAGRSAADQGRERGAMLTANQLRQVAGRSGARDIGNVESM